MLELNLIPEDLKTSQKKVKGVFSELNFSKIPPVPVAIGIISVMIACQVILGFFVFVQKRQLADVSRKTLNLSGQKNIASALKREVDELNGRFSLIEGLTQGSLVWSKKLYDLNNAIIDGIWLTSLSLNYESLRTAAQAHMPKGNTSDRQTLVINGLAIASEAGEETATVGRFIDSLKKSKNFFKDFDDIKLSSVQRESHGNAEVMNFTVICYFKQDRSYFERLQG
jgi:Tfp pilus assembly protein PilN